jgi:hypothetical protein
MEQVVKDLESLKNGEKYHDFCIDDAIFHIRKAQEIVIAADSGPEDWFKQQQEVSTLFVQVLPFLVAASNCTTQGDTYQ